MFNFKYYKKIEAAQKETQENEQGKIKPFDINELNGGGFLRSLVAKAIKSLIRPALAVLREVCPNLRIAELVIVTHHSDVLEVLANREAFEVPFGREMKELAGGSDFVLGLEDAPHERQNKLIASVMSKDDTDFIRERSKYVAEQLLNASGGRIDVMRDFITRVATVTCVEYFGLTVENHDQFADWSFSLSALLFGDPTGNPVTRRLALAGAERICAVTERAIRDSKIRLADPDIADGDSLVDRLVKKQVADKSISDGEISAILVGLITGMIPTNTLAAGKIMEELLRRPQVMRQAMAMARDGDFESLEKVVLECGRLNPALAPGQWRYARTAGVIAPNSWWRRRHVPKDSILLVSTQSALRDRRMYPSPGQFILERERDPNVLFGNSGHKCLGQYVATAQITEIFAALLKQTDLQRYTGRAGRMVWLGPFPRRLDMVFKPTGFVRKQTMMVICAPVDEDKASALKAKISALENPAKEEIAIALRKTGIIHFASMTVIEGGDKKNPRPHLLLELNVDGERDDAFDIVAREAGEWLNPIFAEIRGAQGQSLEALLRKHVLDLHTRPWGATGINFAGTMEFCVESIDMQADLATFAHKSVQFFLKSHAGLGSRAMSALGFVRKVIHQHPDVVALLDKQTIDASERKIIKDLLTDGAKFKDHLIWPSRRRLQISEWEAPTGLDGFRRLLRSAELRPFLKAGITLLLFTMVAHYWASWSGGTGSAVWLAAIIQSLFSLSMALLSLVVLALAVFALFVGLLRYHEKRDIPDDQDPPVDLIDELAISENHFGYAQNHLTAIPPLKTGWFRKLTLAAALWGIARLIETSFRPGFVLNMGTIHYARWFRLPDTDKLVFTTNYDGSWESYLEDFITKAQKGQTAAWSNCIGFPRTRYLFQDGARDGDRFKRWVRRQQVVTGFWFSNFPELTTDQIRNNAMIHDGLMRAHDDTAARAWLDQFGTVPRPDYAIETEEVQSLVFRGDRGLPHGTCALLHLPEDSTLTRNWLDKLVNADGFNDKVKDLNMVNLIGDTNELGRITFGDRAHLKPDDTKEPTCFVSFSAAGLAKIGLLEDQEKPEDRLSTFPTAFNIGMANRQKILGDTADSAPSAWEWADADQVAGKGKLKAVHVALIIHADDEPTCQKLIAAHLAALGGEDCLIARVMTQPVEQEGEKAPPPNSEHFGFRDGISQPVIRGTRRFSKGADPKDVVAPGEFILGYRNNQDFFPSSVSVRPDMDPNERLPVSAVESSGEFPRFRLAEEPDVRDFGRNGTFIAIRQLVQEVEDFRKFAHDKATELRKMNNLHEIIGGPITPEWVAAKMMGRWQDGTSLIERPAVLPEPAVSSSENDSDAETEKDYSQAKTEDINNSFNFGDDDPQGLHCPFGAHIRRTNPRQSLHPTDPTQEIIVGRHRILRRGRPYQRTTNGDGPDEKGLLFLALCGDLERQFEFVQQTWINSPYFHGLKDEPDPIVASKQPDLAREFTIPTAAGSITLNDMKSFVTVRGGGYFFLPGRSSLLFLIDLLDNKERQN